MGLVPYNSEQTSCALPTRILARSRYSVASVATRSVAGDRVRWGQVPAHPPPDGTGGGGGGGVEDDWAVDRPLLTVEKTEVTLEPSAWRT
jgi:hypothetical protein